MILLAVAALCVGVVLTLLVLLPFLKKRGVETGQVLSALHTGVHDAGTLAQALKASFPENQALGTLDQIARCAELGVARAEQLCKIDGIPREQRKEEAVRFVCESLSLAGIEPTEEIRAVADGCIEAAVFALGHHGASAYQ